MTGETRIWSLAALGALLALCAAPAALAQDNSTIGNPQLRDFQLRPRQQQQQQPTPLTTQPVQQAPPPVVIAPPPVVRPQAAPPPAAARPQTPAPAQPLPQAQTPRPQPAPAAATPRPQAPAPQAPGQPRAEPAAPPPEAAPPAATETPAPAVPGPLPPLSTPPAEKGGSGSPWLYLLPAAALALLGLALLLRRRRRGRAWAEEEAEAPAPAAAAAPIAAPPAPLPDPAQRPWLELTLKAERATATLTETVVNFELEIANSGKEAARNLRIDVKMFNPGNEQDREIGAFFRTAGRETTKLNLPGLPAGTSGLIQGEVAMPRDEMRAVVLDDKYLFVPVIAVNALYDWGDGLSGQTSKSYVVGRELQQPGEKMGAFRVDQGPRVWRTVGQRQHNLARRV